MTTNRGAFGLPDDPDASASRSRLTDEAPDAMGDDTDRDYGLSEDDDGIAEDYDELGNTLLDANPNGSSAMSASSIAEAEQDLDSIAQDAQRLNEKSARVTEKSQRLQKALEEAEIETPSPVPDFDEGKLDQILAAVESASNSADLGREKMDTLQDWFIDKAKDKVFLAEVAKLIGEQIPPPQPMPAWQKFGPLVLSGLATVLLLINLSVTSGAAANANKAAGTADKAAASAAEAARIAEALRQVFGTPDGGKFDPSQEIISFSYTRDSGVFNLIVGPPKDQVQNGPTTTLNGVSPASGNGSGN